MCDVDLSKINIHIPGLPVIFQNYQIVQISDFHLGTHLNHKHLEQIVSLVNSLSPDLTVITGDFVNHDAKKFAPDIAKALGELEPIQNKFAVLGNHDHWTDPGAIRWALDRSNVRELRNSCTHIRRNGSEFILAGIDDHLAGCDDLDQVLDLMPPGYVAILLAHEPDFADISAATGRFSLQLSGHSHGGQIYLPLIGSPYLPRLGRNYPSGYYEIKDLKLYTNRGLGTSWLGLRINCPPEITIINLLAHEASSQDVE